MQSGMSFKAYLLAMTAASVVAWLGWLVVILRVDPLETGNLGLFLFYLTLFAGLVGTFAVAGVVYRLFILKRQELVIREARISFRHGLMLAFVAIVSLALSAQALLSWRHVLALICLVGMTEYVFVTIDESRRL